MPEIKWIASSAANWNTASAWQGGVVPGIGDTAVFTSLANSGGDGNCTLDANTSVGGLKLLNDYAGTFSQNGQPLTVGNAGTGELHILKAAVLNNAVNFYGNDFYYYTLSTTNTQTIYFFTDCDCRMNVSMRSHSIATGATVTMRNSRHSLYPAMAVFSNFRFNGGTATVNGVLDLTEMTNYNIQYSTAPTFNASNGILRNRSSASKPIAGNPLHFTFGQLDGLFDLNMEYTAGANARTITGDFRRFADAFITFGTGYQGAPIHLSASVIDRLAVITNSPLNSLIILPDVSDITGDFTVTQNGDGKILFQTASAGTPQFTLIGTADQIMDAGDNTVGLCANKQAGLVTISGGDFHLTADSTFPDGLDFAPWYSGCFRQNGKTMSIFSAKLHLLELASAQYVLSGPLVFGGHDFVLKNTVLSDDCVLVFTAHCTARFISEYGKSCSPGGMHIEQNARLVLTATTHDMVSGKVLDAIGISGDLTITGTLGFYDPGQYRLVMSGDEKVCQPGKFITGMQSEIIIEPKSNAVQPIDIEIIGNARLFWGQDVTTIHLLPGNYKGFREICVPSHIAECRLSAGQYDFNMLNVATPNSGEILLAQTDDGNVVVYGQTVITGNGTCRNTIDFLRLEHLQLNAFLQLTTASMQIDHPVVLSGNIFGNGKLILSGTRPFQLGDDSLNVGELHIYDGDGSFSVPASGYQSLTLEARNCDSLLTLRGEYHLASFTMLADANTLKVHVDQTTTIHCAGDIITQKSGNGNIRWLGDGIETWVFEGDSPQMIDMSLEHGDHVLGTMLNDKSEGTLTVVSPMCVTYYLKPDGTPLPAPENMTVLSAISLQCHLFLATDGTGEWWSQEGTRLENGTVISGGTVALYARLADQNGQTIQPKLVENIRMNCNLMNPMTPYLHDPRRTVIRDLELAVPQVLSPGWRTDEHRCQEGYNFCLGSSMFRELRFEQPGLYYVTFVVKLFGQKNALPFRYEIHCERPLIQSGS